MSLVRRIKMIDRQDKKRRIQLIDRLNVWRGLLGQSTFPRSLSTTSFTWAVCYDDCTIWNVFTYNLTVWKVRKVARFNTCEKALDFIDEMPSNQNAVFIVATAIPL